MLIVNRKITLIILKTLNIKPLETITEHFAILTDPRVDRTKHHKLIDIITIAICAIICGVETWVGIAAYGNAKYEWLKQFLELPSGHRSTTHSPGSLRH